MTQVTFKRDQLTIDYSDPNTNQLLETIVESQRDEALVTINQLQMVMINRHLVVLGEEQQLSLSPEMLMRKQEGHEMLQDNEEQMAPIEKLLEPSRITVKYENIVKEGGL